MVNAPRHPGALTLPTAAHSMVTAAAALPIVALGAFVVQAVQLGPVGLAGHLLAPQTRVVHT